MSYDYEVLVRNIFEADSPWEAVQDMVEWLSEVANQTGYFVRNLDTGEQFFIDTEMI